MLLLICESEPLKYYRVELAGFLVFGSSHPWEKRIHLARCNHCKPIRVAFQILHNPCRYRLYKSFQPPGEHHI
jgi:hypothetical protein